MPSNYLTGTPKSSIMLKIAEILQKKEGNVLYIAKSREELLTLENFASFCGIDFLTLPSFDADIYEAISPTYENLNQRIEALYKILTRQYQLIITDTRALMQKIPHLETLFSQAFAIKRNDHLKLETLINILSNLGFHRVMNAIEVGEYAVRGGILDLVLNYGSEGIRIDFLGDIVESIKTYDVSTQKSLKTLERFIILPTSEIILSQDNIENFKQQYRLKFKTIDSFIYTQISSGYRVSGIENYLPLFYENMVSVLDYIPYDTKIIYYEEIWAESINFYEEASKSFIYRKEKSEPKNGFFPIEPELLYLDQPKIENILETRDRYIASAADREQASIETKINYKAKAANKSIAEVLKEYIAKYKDIKFVIACNALSSIERVKDLLDEDMEVANIGNLSMLERMSSSTIGMALLDIDESFTYGNFCFITESDLLSTSKMHIAKKSSSKRLMEELTTISQGELVVHKDYGIGLFQGIVSLEVKDIVKDFAEIHYANCDKLFVPIENLELITRYGEGDINHPLDKLGAASWQKRKAELKEKVLLSAKELIALAAQRQSAIADTYDLGHDLYSKFLERFKFVETKDQMKAIEEVLEDLAVGKPMDRLVCADVGFGKTEVALRAACSVVLDDRSFQVAVIVPTTLLARQHFATFSERFADFSIKVEQLSKFTPRSSIKRIKEGLKDGTVNIVIGTHALLASDIEFKNLGLIVIDEEQHFGVKQKEKLKKIKSQAHVLTLSATPIPRTMHMALSGIKDLSIIATPPLNRYPVSTYVMPFDELTVRDAIIREKNRGGRTFFVTPRVKYMDSLKEQLEALVPEVKIASAHGKMAAGKLDDIMNDFYDGKYDVLLSTMIVESGLDIPSANTLIVDHANMLGLAQSYQIRGRVGRSNVKAYAYFTYPSRTRLSENAARRLDILQSLQDLGSGFSISSHDMDIRGYGNLVGEEQSGHVKEVGLELYQEMLTEALKELALPNQERGLEADHSYSPILNLGIAARIPEEYIADSNLRFSLYRKVSSIESSLELEDIKIEFIDRFGAMPCEVNALFSVIEIRQLAKKANIEKIDMGGGVASIKFRNDQPFYVDKVMSFVSNNAKEVSITPEQKLIIKNPRFNEENAVKVLKGILEENLV